MTPVTPPLSPTAVLRRNSVHVHGPDLGKPALVLVNGFGCDQGGWRLVAPHFATDRQVVLFDHVGTGHADAGDFDRAKYASLQGYADDLLAVCSAAGIQDAVVVGHSVGAIIAVLAAVRAPDAFRHLVLIGPGPCFLNDGSYLGGFEREDLDVMLDAMDANYAHWAHQMAPLIMGAPERPELARELESGMNRMPPTVARQFARVSFDSDHREELRRLRTPATVLQCDEDNIVPEVVAESVCEAIADCTLVRLAASGHCPHLSAPEAVVEALRDVLNQDWIETEPAELDA
jgi:sigma-B regulation protein RsbQ